MKNKAPLVLTVLICAAVVGAGGWLFYHKSGMETEPAPEASNAPSLTRKAARTFSAGSFQIIAGRWMRPDGGYVIDIRNVGADGQLEAAYFNPHPIHVSKARLTAVNNVPQVFIELRDAGYPGATYRLIYHPEQDVLAGLYHQPAVGQRFEVVFIRANP